MIREAFDKFDRLRGMDSHEISGRLHTALRCTAERLRFYSFGLLPPGRLLPSLSGRSACYKRYFEGAPAQRFYLPDTREGREQAGQFVETCFPEWKSRAVDEAERLCRHEVELLGYGRIALGPAIDWLQDPLTGHLWPVRFWADYDLVRDSAAGDPKTIHELNRHQHLPRLGKAYFLTGEERYAREALDQMFSWIEQNPEGAGINWNSSLEIALRIISWLWTLFFILPSSSFGEAEARQLAGSLAAQLAHVHRYPSTFSSPNTHLLGEAAALYLGGTLFAEWEPAGDWKKAGQQMLLEELEKQISPEGIHGELSSCYHCYALDFYLQTLALAVHGESCWPDHVWRRVEAMMDYLMHLTRPGGGLPSLSDDDGGRALALSRTQYRSFSDALSAGAVLFGRPDFKYVAGEFCEETFWLLGEKAWHIYADLPSHRPRALQASYPGAGYFIQRSGWDRNASHLVFDCGEMGMLRGGHGHADALSLTLSAGGRELLLDPGTGQYNRAPEWRNFFRSSQAHNTVLVDGVEQSEPAGTFSWKSTAQPRLRRQIAREEFDYVEGEHSGYLRLPEGIIHRRAVLYCRPDYWLVIDRFSGQGRHRFEWFYHFPAEATLSLCQSLESRDVSVRARTGSTSLRLLVCSPVAASSEIVCGRNDRLLGWQSCRYGQRAASPTLTVSLESAVPLAVFSILIPAASAAASECLKLGGHGSMQRVETDDPSMIAGMLHHGDYQDLWVAGDSEDAEAVLPHCRMKGEFFWLRTFRDGSKQLMALNAFWFAEEQHALMESTGAPTSLVIHWGAEGKLVEPLELGEETSCAAFAA